MGTARAKGFGPALLGPDMKNTWEDETITDKDGDAGNKNINAHNNKYLQLIDIGAGAGELKQRKDVTKIVIDSVFVTEDQS